MRSERRRYGDRIAQAALVLAVAAVAIACVSTWVSLASLRDIRDNQHDIRDNQTVLARLEGTQCDRVQRLRTQTNRGLAVIYVVLRMTSEGSPARRFADSVAYNPPTNCDIAATDPDYRPPAAVPFSDLTETQLALVLKGIPPDSRSLP